MGSPGEAYEWFLRKKVRSEAAPVCSHRDVLNARLSSLSKSLLKRLSPEDVALITAVAGEIGNNCFDHNLGKWTDALGAYLSFGTAQGALWVAISDRGQGLRSSLKKVIPDLKTSQEAIDVAFYKRVTGRAPELRGNGLKFVREIINSVEGRGLFYQTNHAYHMFGSLGMKAQSLLGKVKDTKGPDGTFALIVWEGA